MKKIIIIGGGDLCHKIVRLIQRDNIFDIIGYVDVKDRGTIFNAKYLGNDGVIEKFNKKVKKLCVALAFGGNMQYFPKRKIIINKILKIGVDTPPIISKLASFERYSTIGKGSIIFQGAYVEYSVNIGDFSIINTNSTICHDVNIDANVIVSPKSVLLGRSAIGENSFIGGNVTLGPGVVIGHDCVIGSGSNVVKDCNKKGTYIGNPAKKI